MHTMFKQHLDDVGSGVVPALGSHCKRCQPTVPYHVLYLRLRKSFCGVCLCGFISMRFKSLIDKAISNILKSKLKIILKKMDR